MDKICIRRLEVYAHHGVYEEEKRLGQKFYITVEMELDTRAAGISDDLQASVNYGEVCLRIVEWTKSHRRKLIEAAAEDIAHYLLVQYPMVRKVTIAMEHRHDIQERQIDHRTDEGIYSVCFRQ